MKTIITGAAGFIGYHLAARLADQGKELILIDNFRRGQKDREFKKLIRRSNVRFIEMELTEKGALSQIQDHVSEIYHLAAINGTGNFYSIPDQVLRVNVLATLNLLEWSRDKNDVKIIYSSSSEVYAGGIKSGIARIPTGEDAPLCIDDISNVRWSYGASKILGESAFFSYGQVSPFRFSIIRYHNIYGPRMGFGHVVPQFFHRINQGEVPLKVYGGQQTRAFCYISDAVRATQLVMESPVTDKKIIHIGNDGKEIKIVDLAKLILEITDNTPEVIEKSPPEGSVNRRCPDISFLRSLGFCPRVGIKEGLSYTRKWYKKVLQAQE